MHRGIATALVCQLHFSLAEFLVTFSAQRFVEGWIECVNPLNAMPIRVCLQLRDATQPTCRISCTSRVGLMSTMCESGKCLICCRPQFCEQIRVHFNHFTALIDWLTDWLTYWLARFCSKQGIIWDPDKAHVVTNVSVTENTAADIPEDLSLQFMSPLSAHLWMAWPRIRFIIIRRLLGRRHLRFVTRGFDHCISLLSHAAENLAPIVFNDIYMLSVVAP